MIFTYDDADEWFADVVSHGCTESLLSADNPAKLRIGYTCIGCGQSYQVNLSSLKNLHHNHWLYDVIDTTESRMAFSSVLNGRAVLILEEWE